MTPLDDPVRAALTGPQAYLAVTVANAIRFRPDVAPFMAPTADAWRVVSSFEVVQMTAGSKLGEPAPEALALGDADVPEMLALTQLTNPGPFLPRTIEMGDYIGVRDGSELVAMAGERFRVPGWTEISAVCTAPTHRGQGLATRLLRAVAAGIEARGEGVFLHVVATNTGAIRLYEALGFSIRGRRTVGAIVPANGTDAVPHGVALITAPQEGRNPPTAAARGRP
jgi:ribosomal protein S18 acetylase RimI-like enzyme